MAGKIYGETKFKWRRVPNLACSGSLTEWAYCWCFKMPHRMHRCAIMKAGVGYIGGLARIVVMTVNGRSTIIQKPSHIWLVTASYCKTAPGLLRRISHWLGLFTSSSQWITESHLKVAYGGLTMWHNWNRISHFQIIQPPEPRSKWKSFSTAEEMQHTEETWGYCHASANSLAFHRISQITTSPFKRIGASSKGSRSQCRLPTDITCINQQLSPGHRQSTAVGWVPIASNSYQPINQFNSWVFLNGFVHKWCTPIAGWFAY